MTTAKNDLNSDVVLSAINKFAKEQNLTPIQIVENFISSIDDPKAIASISKAIKDRTEAIKAEALSNYIKAGKELAQELNIDPQTIADSLVSTRAKNVQVEPRYRNKSNSDETWTGRGKQPKWLVAEIEKGAKLEDFLITPAAESKA
ncbi:H-NS histone family protein [Acinetobacter pittii]